MPNQKININNPREDGEPLNIIRRSQDGSRQPLIIAPGKNADFWVSPGEEITIGIPVEDSKPSALVERGTPLYFALDADEGYDDDAWGMVP